MVATPPLFSAVQKYSPSCAFLALSIRRMPFSLDSFTSAGSWPPGPPNHLRTGAGKPVAEQRNSTESPSLAVTYRGAMETWGPTTAGRKVTLRIVNREGKSQNVSYPFAHLSKLWKAKFFILCDVIFQVRENLKLITLGSERVKS